jgi:hypothetical protein
MMKYRVVFISSRGQPFAFRSLDARDEDDAVRWACRTFQGVEMEIQHNNRTIAKVTEEAKRAVAA